MGINKINFCRMSNVEEYIFLARVAEQAERFEDMVDQLEHVLAEKGADVTSDERNLLSVAFKNLISSKRAACRTIAAIEQNPKYSKFGDALLQYKTGIESKLQGDCQRIIDMINNKVLSKPCDGEPKAFFIKMVKQQALAAYNEANSITLPPCNPIKLGLALNFSVFHYEAMKNHKAACDLADQSLQDALDKIDELEEDDFRDAKSIIELLKENLTLWREEEDNDNAIDDL